MGNGKNSTGIPMTITKFEGSDGDRRDATDQPCREGSGGTMTRRNWA